MILRSSAGKEPPQCSPAAVPIVLALTTIYSRAATFPGRTWLAALQFSCAPNPHMIPDAPGNASRPHATDRRYDLPSMCTNSAPVLQRTVSLVSPTHLRAISDTPSGTTEAQPRR